MCIMVQTKYYAPLPISALFPYAPVFYREAKMGHNCPPLHHQCRHVSVVRNRALYEVITHSTERSNGEGRPPCCGVHCGCRYSDPSKAEIWQVEGLQSRRICPRCQM